MSDYIYNIGSLFTKIAGENAEKTALKYPDGTAVTYSELNLLTRKLETVLRANGLKKGDVISLFNNKSPLAYACMLAALETGIIYTNLDFTSPFERVKKIIDRCKPKLLFFDMDCDIREDVCTLGIPTINLYDNFDVDAAPIAVAEEIVRQRVTGSDAAYIMFTSGSTGFPKGAVITHANLLNFISWGKTTFNITGDDICTNANPIYFDNSVFDFYVTLFSGAQLVPLTNDITRDPFQLVKAVAAARCTTWFSVPSLLVYLMTTKALGAGSLPAMRRFIFGGEGFPKPRLKKLYELYGHIAGLYNVYGPTECTCICSSHLIADRDFDDMNSLATLGYLAPNFDYVLINTDETGKFGELCLKGPNVGAGYYNDPERTAGSFIQNPYNGYYNEVVYKTGDLVEVDAVGHLHFRGRIDNQVKHMGYRIELEEIESLLNTLNYVNEAAVIYDRINESLGQIIAYVSAQGVDDALLIIADLKSLVPEYMVPRKLHIMAELPKNQNGKIDKVALKNKK